MARKPVKSPIAIVRDVDTITKEYGNLCGQAGEAQYKIKKIEADLNQFNKRLAELQIEHYQASQEAQRKAESKQPEVEATDAV